MNISRSNREARFSAFLAGVGSVLTLFPSLPAHPALKGLNEVNAMTSDWGFVGQDLKDAMSTYGQEQEKQKLAKPAK